MFTDQSCPGLLDYLHIRVIVELQRRVVVIKPLVRGSAYQLTFIIRQVKELFIQQIKW